MMSERMQQAVLKRIPMAEVIAVRVWNAGSRQMELEELKNQAYFALVDAASRWEPYCEANGHNDQDMAHFDNYARLRISGEVTHFTRTFDWANRLARERMRALRDAGLGDGIGIEELSERTGLSGTQIRAAQQATSLQAKPISMDDPDNTIHFSFRDSTEMSYAERQILAILGDTIERMDTVSQAVIALHYYAGIDIKSIAGRLRITEAKVRRIHTDAILAIRDALQNMALALKEGAA